MDLSEPPADGPRSLPWRFVYRLFTHVNRLGWIAIGGACLGIALLWGPWQYGIPLLIASLALVYIAYLRPFRRFLALRYGAAVPGKIETIHCSRPSGPYTLYKIYYRFDLNGRPMRNVKWTYSYAATQHFIGEPVWVVLLPRTPICNALWPPFV